MPPPAAADGFDLTQWYLFCNVYYSQTSEYVSAFFNTVENPFVNQHAVALPSNPATRAAAQYDFAWAEQFGQFLISAQLQAEDTGGFHVRSLAEGTIYLQSTVDLTLTVEATYMYDLPVNPMLARAWVRAVDVQTSQAYFNQYYAEDTWDGQPASGTFVISGQATLPAGRTYWMQYHFDLHAWGNSHTLATGNGFVNLTITPEPATLGLVLPAALCLARRSRRRRRNWR